jgi:diaminohydroxyphosphoribosylaminopyrimidine deaminase/5-amino-6-(5-phosphoribosylamino)uracil reductase
VTHSDGDWLAAAAALAERGVGRTGTNPPVGCILVCDGRPVGRGWTQPDGRPHAEAMAIAAAGDAASGATAYVTLEPCAHVSARGPACSDLLIEAGIARAVIGVRDPDPRTAGAGLARLRAAGIDAGFAADPPAPAGALAGYLTRRALGRPHVTAKLALSLDGGIALADGTSRWITGERARAHGHLERARADMVLVGGGTLRADAPRLDVRLPGLEARAPGRLLLSRTASVPAGWTRIDRPESIRDLPCNRLLIEGGGETVAAFLAADLVDRLLLYRAPLLLGGGARSLGALGLADLASAHGRWRLADRRSLAPDSLEIFARLR